MLLLPSESNVIHIFMSKRSFLSIWWAEGLGSRVGKNKHSSDGVTTLNIQNITSHNTHTTFLIFHSFVQSPNLWSSGANKQQHEDGVHLVSGAPNLPEVREGCVIKNLYRFNRRSRNNKDKPTTGSSHSIAWQKTFKPPVAKRFLPRRNIRNYKDSPLRKHHSIFLTLRLSTSMKAVCLVAQFIGG